MGTWGDPGSPSVFVSYEPLSPPASTVALTNRHPVIQFLASAWSLVWSAAQNGFNQGYQFGITFSISDD